MAKEYFNCPHCHSIHLINQPGCILVTEWSKWRPKVEAGRCMAIYGEDMPIHRITKPGVNKNWPQSPYEIEVHPYIGAGMGAVYRVREDKVIKLLWSEFEVKRDSWLNYKHVLYFELIQLRGQNRRLRARVKAFKAALKD